MRFHTEKVEYQGDFRIIRNFYLIGSVHIGIDSGCSAFHQNISTDQRDILIVENLAPDFPYTLLRSCLLVVLRNLLLTQGDLFVHQYPCDSSPFKDCFQDYIDIRAADIDSNGPGKIQRGVVVHKAVSGFPGNFLKYFRESEVTAVHLIVFLRRSRCHGKHERDYKRRQEFD